MSEAPRCTCDLLTAPPGWKRTDKEGHYPDCPTKGCVCPDPELHLRLARMSGRTEIDPARCAAPELPNFADVKSADIRAMVAEAEAYEHEQLMAVAVRVREAARMSILSNAGKNPGAEVASAVASVEALDLVALVRLRGK